MDYQKIYTTLFNAITDALSQIETQNGAPRRGERSNAALAGNSKTMKIRSRRRLLKTVDTQAKRQRR